MRATNRMTGKQFKTKTKTKRLFVRWAGTSCSLLCALCSLVHLLSHANSTITSIVFLLGATFIVRRSVILPGTVAYLVLSAHAIVNREPISWTQKQIKSLTTPLVPAGLTSFMCFLFVGTHPCEPQVITIIAVIPTKAIHICPYRRIRQVSIVPWMQQA